LRLGTGKARTFLDLAKAVFSALKIPENIEFRVVLSKWASINNRASPTQPRIGRLILPEKTQVDLKVSTRQDLATFFAAPA
jgi:hypothetical protein